MALAACSDDAGVIDASGDTAVDVPEDVMERVPDPMPPAPPALPALTPCPDGWQEVAVGPTRACEPWPEGTEGCTFPEVRFVGEDACAPLGPACPMTGDWPAELADDGAVIFVREGAMGGDGSMGAPFGTLADAVTAVTAGQTIALAIGTYDGDIEVPEDVTVRGACVAGTEVVGSPGDIPLATFSLQPGSAVRDLRISGGRSGILLNSGGAASVANLWIGGAGLGLGVSNTGTVLDAENIVIEDLVRSDDGPIGVFVVNDSEATVRRLYVQGLEGTPVGANGGGHVTVEDAALLDTTAPPSTALGIGASALNRGFMELRRVLVDGTNSAGVFVAMNGNATLTDVVVRNVQLTEGRGAGSFGIGVTNGSTASVERIFVSHSEASPILVLGFRSQMTGTDVVAASPLPATVEELTATGILVDTGQVDLERVLVHDVRNAGVTITRMQSSGTFRDLTVEGTRPETVGEAALGIDVNMSGVASIERAALSDNVAGGVVVSGASSSITLRDILISGTLPTESGRFGRGLAVQGGAALSAERISVVDNVEVGVFVHGEGPLAMLRDVSIERTLLSDDSGAGNGLAAVESAQVDVDGFRIADNALAGIQIATGARVIAHAGVVSGSPIGVNIQMSDVDPSDFSDRVVYVDNQQNLDASELPVPSPTQ